tara:strand:- start:115 stop:366 length:252 start_codon:yes stop_codon:yes gene_type:complete
MWRHGLLICFISASSVFLLFTEPGGREPPGPAIRHDKTSPPADQRSLRYQGKGAEQESPLSASTQLDRDPQGYPAEPDQFRNQ